MTGGVCDGDGDVFRWMMDDDDGDVCAPQERITVPQDIPQLCSYFFLEPDFSTASARQLAAKAVTASTRTCRHAVLLFLVVGWMCQT